MALTSEFVLAGVRISSLAGIASWAGVFLALCFAYTCYSLIYNTYFHPLKHIPGPWLARASWIPYVYHTRGGTIVPWVHAQHEAYGHAVRVNPNEVSFTSGETAWPEIYGFRTGKYKKTGSYEKDQGWYARPINGVRGIISAAESEHSRMRRNLSHAFSDKALRQQETLIQAYVDLLIHRLGENARKGKTVDMMRWYNYATFDIITDLTFGEALHCLRDEKYHDWVELVMHLNVAISIVSTRQRYRLVAYWDMVQNFFVDKAAVLRARVEFMARARSLVEARVDEGAEDRPDFFSAILKNQEKGSMALTREEMVSNAVTLLVAGSETTATALSGATFLLLKNPAAYSKVVQEIRSRFKSQAEITVEEVNKLTYMNACLQEVLRLYPPVPTGFPRIVPSGGDTISDYYIPEGTSVYVSQHATCHSSRNFKTPEAFVPERWLGDEEYKNDKRDTVSPFSFGPRNCLGKNLAYAEMRLILAKVLFNFDLELVDQHMDWMRDQKVHSLWQKPALMVKLKAMQN